MINRLAVVTLLLTVNAAMAQYNNQTSSPYSLFGLGSLNEANAGKTNALGKSGIALPADTGINNLNPAAYADIPKNSFLFDVGAKGTRNTYTNNADQSKNTTYNFSNISVALSFSEKSGIGITMSPYSDVGYSLQGVTGTVEGSQQTFTSYIQGSGGLNNVAVNYGYKITPKLNLGINASYYFGKISENEQVALGAAYLAITQENYYKGLRPALGLQYKVNPGFTVASVITAPANLTASQDRTVVKIVDDTQVVLDATTGGEADAFKLPLEAAIGIKYRLKSFTFNADYKRSFWDATGIEDNIGTFADQDFVGLGVQYTPNVLRPSYVERIQYRLGYNMDNGYLEVNDNRIKNFAVTSGLGLPLSYRGSSSINISYSYGQRGAVSNTLVQEKYHLFTVNISLEDIWFVKRKYE